MDEGEGEVAFGNLYPWCAEAKDIRIWVGEAFENSRPALGFLPFSPFPISFSYLGIICVFGAETTFVKLSSLPTEFPGGIFMQQCK